MWDQKAAIQHLNAHAQSHSTGACALYVRRAIAAGGVQLQQTRSAKDYGNSLLIAGFTALLSTQIMPEAGDVAVIQAIPGHNDGHMAMYNGSLWVSDFKQLNGYYPGDSYRTQQPSVVFYRKLN